MDTTAHEEFAILTNIIHQKWTGVSVKDHKALKGLRSQNLRDHMSEAELSFNALAELATRQNPASEEQTRLQEQQEAEKIGREELEPIAIGVCRLWEVAAKPISMA